MTATFLPSDSFLLTPDQQKLHNERFWFCSFTLDPEFVDQYAHADIDWGFELPTGDSLSELTYVTKYSRILPNGLKERWYQTCERVINGTFSILVDHYKINGIEFSDAELANQAQQMYDAMFRFAWLPPGRGLWSMGTYHVNGLGDSSRLQNCSFWSTQNLGTEWSEWFEEFMLVCMAGVGCGFDTQGAGQLVIQQPVRSDDGYIIEDSKEGWAQSTQDLLSAFLDPTGEIPLYDFDYSRIRPAGSLISSGGIAPGPEPLRRLHNKLEEILSRKAGEKITSRTIIDIVNLIGKSVVAGGVRRCLREGTWVQTSTGMKPIEEIKIGEMVSTLGGWKEVLDSLSQGVQECVRVRHEDGWIDCTPDHRIAVLDHVDGRHHWVEAQDLKPGDRLVYVANENSYEESRLPSWSYINPAHSTTSVDITIPQLDEGIAWLIGLVHGDGYVYIDRNDEGHIKKGCISIACDTVNNTEIIDRAVEQLSRFGVSPKVKDRDGNYCVVKVSSNQLASYFHMHIKQPKTSLKIPDFIKFASPEIRLAYLSGIMDADGSVVSRPKTLALTCYELYAKELQNLCYSLGFTTRLKVIDSTNTPSRNNDNWQTLYKVNLISLESQDALRKSCGIKELSQNVKVQSSNGFPCEMVKTDLGWTKGVCLTGPKQVPFETVRRLYPQDQIHPGIVPLKVLGVEELGEYETYDLTVEDEASFVADGVLVHNTALLSLGDYHDDDFLTIKDWNLPQNEERMGPDGWGWTSNNTFRASVGQDYSKIVDSIKVNGEPGILWTDTMVEKGRTNTLSHDDIPQDHAIGTNPCSEISLESGEFCTLVEIPITKSKSYMDFVENAQMAYMYAKIVTLMDVAFESSVPVMQRNRRIGTSITGLAEFVESSDHSFEELIQWCDSAYKTLRDFDKTFSAKLGVPESVRITTVKPSGTVSLLAGCTPGVHWPVATGAYLRRMRFANHDPLLNAFVRAGYHVEPALGDTETTSVVTFPVCGPEIRSERNVSLKEKVAMATLMQQWWSDNMVSVTFTFLPNEANLIESIIKDSEGKLKCMSFLPLGEKATYPQQPYETVDQSDWEERAENLTPLDWDYMYGHSADAVAEAGCTNDTCEIKF